MNTFKLKKDDPEDYDVFIGRLVDNCVNYYRCDSTYEECKCCVEKELEKKGLVKVAQCKGCKYRYILDGECLMGFGYPTDDFYCGCAEESKYGE